MAVTSAVPARCRAAQVGYVHKKLPLGLAGTHTLSYLHVYSGTLLKFMLLLQATAQLLRRIRRQAQRIRPLARRTRQPHQHIRQPLQRIHRPVPRTRRLAQRIHRLLPVTALPAPHTAQPAHPTAPPAPNTHLRALPTALPHRDTRPQAQVGYLSIIHPLFNLLYARCFHMHSASFQPQPHLVLHTHQCQWSCRHANSLV